MCGKCQTEYNKYKELKEKYVETREQVGKCKDLANKTVENFNHVIIDGKSVEDGVVSNCSVSLLKVGSSLNTLIKQCDEKMNEIESSCPGPDHYEPKGKRNRNRNK